MAIDLANAARRPPYADPPNRDQRYATFCGVLGWERQGPEDIPLAERKQLNGGLRRRMQHGSGWGLHTLQHDLWGALT